MKHIFEELKSMDIAIFDAESISLSSDITLCKREDFLQLLRTSKPTHCFVKETRYEGNVNTLDYELTERVLNLCSPQSIYNEQEDWVWDEVPKLPTVVRIKDTLRDMYTLAEKYSNEPYERSYCFIVHGVGYQIDECYSEKAKELLYSPHQQIQMLVVRYDQKLRKDFESIEQRRREMELNEHEEEIQQMSDVYGELLNHMVNDAEFAQCINYEKRRRYLLLHYVDFCRKYPNAAECVYTKRAGKPSLTIWGKLAIDQAWSALQERATE